MLSEKLLKLLDEEGFVVSDQDEVDCDVSIYTPAGEDWHFALENDEHFVSYVEGFDPDDEFEMLFNSGLSGLPRPTELIQDQLWKQETLNRILEEYYK